MSELNSPFLLELSFNQADVVLVERVVQAAREIAGNRLRGVHYGIPLFDRDAVDDGG